MRALVISQWVKGSILAEVHGARGFKVERILVPEANNLIIAPHGEHFFVFALGDQKSEYEVLREIDIPDELVEQALAFSRMRDNLKGTFRAIIKRKR